MVERDQVAMFLSLLRQCAACEFRFERRSENMATLARLGMTITEAKQRILALTPADYSSGPTPRSESSSQDAWVFGITAQSTFVYGKSVSDSSPPDAYAFHSTTLNTRCACRTAMQHPKGMRSREVTRVL